MSKKPHILHIFSKYSQYGGEEACFFAMNEILTQITDITPFVYSTQELAESPHNSLTKARYLLHNKDVEQQLRALLSQYHFDAWIIHNTFPAMSPCVYEIALEQHVPIIHYVHNYRAGCLKGVFFREGNPCFSCQSGNYLHGIMHKCWRDSYPMSCIASSILRKTKRLGVWQHLSAYVAVSHRQKELLVQCGLPEEKVHVIPHFLDLKEEIEMPPHRRDILFTGRLSEEKGIFPLIQAWERLKVTDRTLYIMGDGPLRQSLEDYVKEHHLTNITFTGFIPHEEQAKIRHRCGLSIAPSLWDETFGMIVLESWIHKTPIIVTPCGGLPELIAHGKNGWISPDSSVKSLVETLQKAIHSEHQWNDMGMHGFHTLSSRYSIQTWLTQISSLFNKLYLLPL